ncbi:MAG TPA: GMC family oxidoreductase N-terminal domain-containing protein [Stellaceae bacterium]|nr:GMC family oxidoreductase N-terminal domain-containing protein [Stellaceae bacterium]
MIGAGAAGCVIAGRLSERLPQARIALIEAGGERLGLTTKVPGTAFIASTVARHNWNFETEPVPALNGRRLRWFQGRILGGSSSINGMLYLRGHSLEYDQWAQRGCHGWSFDQVLPHFKNAETNTRGATEWHGDKGPIGVKPSRLDLPICDAFLAAAGAAGFPVVDDLNADVVEGFARIDTNIANGRRASTAVAYVQPARRRGNLELLSEATAARIVVENGRARGVEILRGGVRETVWAEREVILCGGTVNSPQLLMLSGIGPADHLASLGIPVVHDAPEVGRNLQNHPSYALSYACSQPVTAYKYLNPKAAIGVGLRYALTGGGSLGESYVATGGYMRSDSSLAVSDTIVVMIPALVSRRGVGFRFSDLFPERHGFTVLVGSGRPLSRGHILLRSTDPQAHPRIFPEYFSEPEDLHALARSVRRMREIMGEAPVRDLIEAELTPGAIANDQASIEEDIRARAGTYFHPSGTCRMGGDPAAIVDPRLRVNGIAGLRVADASIMPAALNACTHAPTIMIGEKAAAMIVEDA